MAFVEYQRNEEALEQARHGGSAQYAIFLKPGRTTIRVLPAWSEKGVWLYEVTEHFIGIKNRTFPCISHGRCPICEHGASLAARGDEEAAKEFRATTRYLVNVLVLSDPNGKFSIKDGVKVMKLPTMVKKALLDLDTDKAGGYGDIVSFHHGMNVNIDRSGQGLNTRYTVKVVPQRTSIIDTIKQEGLNPDSFQLHVLDQFVPVKSYDELVSEFQALMSDAPTSEAAPVAKDQVESQPKNESPVSVQGFAVAAPKVTVAMAPPVFPPKGN